MASELNLSWLDDFLALAGSGNFSRAADERHMTQPAFSRRIRALEDWLGAELFDRSSQPVRLTGTGEWFGKVARELQAAVARVPGEARTVAESASATLRIAATHALSFTFLPAWLRGLEERVALGPVQLLSDVQQRCAELLAQRQVQFVLSHGHPAVADALVAAAYPCRVVGRDRLLPVAAPGPGGKPLHQLGKGGTVAMLSYGDASGLGRIVREVHGRRLAELATRTTFTAHLASVLRSVALDGRGLAWLPHVLVRDDLAQGRLAMAGDPEWSIDVEVRLYRDAKGLAHASEAFWEAAMQPSPPGA